MCYCNDCLWVVGVEIAKPASQRTHRNCTAYTFLSCSTVISTRIVTPAGLEESIG
jgi:hypothetical protein